MNKKKAIELLQIQLEKIDDNQMTLDQWILSTSSVLSRVFPISAFHKITQIEKISDTPQFYNDISNQEKIDIRKRQARNYLKNFIEEIELLDLENSTDNYEVLVKNFSFWVIIICVALISFVAGTLINF